MIKMKNKIKIMTLLTITIIIIIGVLFCGCGGNKHISAAKNLKPYEDEKTIGKTEFLKDATWTDSENIGLLGKVHNITAEQEIDNGTLQVHFYYFDDPVIIGQGTDGEIKEIGQYVSLIQLLLVLYPDKTPTIDAVTVLDPKYDASNFQQDLAEAYAAQGIEQPQAQQEGKNESQPKEQSTNNSNIVESEAAPANTDTSLSKYMKKIVFTDFPQYTPISLGNIGLTIDKSKMDDIDYTDELQWQVMQFEYNGQKISDYLSVIGNPNYMINDNSFMPNSNYCVYGEYEGNNIYICFNIDNDIKLLYSIIPDQDSQYGGYYISPEDTMKVIFGVK